MHGHAWPPSYPSPCMPMSPSYYTHHHIFSLYIIPSTCMGTMHATTLLCPPYPFFLTTFLSLHHVLHAHFLSTCMKPCMESCISSPSHAHLTHSFLPPFSLYTTFFMPTSYPHAWNHAWNHAYHHPLMPTLPILSLTYLSFRTSILYAFREPYHHTHINTH